MRNANHGTPLVLFICFAIAGASQGCGKDHSSRPSTPGNLVAVSADGRVTLSWTESRSADSYTVKRSGNHRGPYIRIAEGIDAATYADREVTNLRLHYYVVSASNRFGESPDSAEIMAVPHPTGAVPAAPSGLVALPGDARIFLSWNGVDGATSYDLRRSEISGGPYASVPGSPVSAPTFADEPLAGGTTYYYVVRATNANGTSSDSPEDSATPTTSIKAPPAPLSLSAAPGDTRISLAWHDSSGATAYKLQRASILGGPYALVTMTTALEFTDAGLVNGAAGYYVVTATNSAGESGPSVEILGIPVAAAAPPPSPADVRLNSGNGRVWLSWTGSPQAAGYRIRRGSAPGAADTTVGETVQPAFCDLGPLNGTTHSYAVTAFNSAGESAPLNEVLSRPAAEFPAPSNLAAHGGDSQIGLSWTAAPGATGYSIKRARTPGGPYSLRAATPDVTYVEAGKNETTYYYVISALNSDGESIDSGEASATPSQSASCASTNPLILIMTGLLSLLRKARGRARGRSSRRILVPEAALRPTL